MNIQDSRNKTRSNIDQDNLLPVVQQQGAHWHRRHSQREYRPTTVWWLVLVRVLVYDLKDREDSYHNSVFIPVLTSRTVCLSFHGSSALGFFGRRGYRESSEEGCREDDWSFMVLGSVRASCRRVGSEQDSRTHERGWEECFHSLVEVRAKERIE